MTDPIGSEPLSHPLGRRQFLAALAGVLLSAPLAAEAQPARKVYRIGLLMLPPREQIAPFLDAFEQGLRDRGYVEGQNVIIERRSANGTPERLANAASELVGLNVDVIVAGPNPTISAAKHATSDIPIVMVFGVDPIGTGFIASLRRPGGNITGGAWDPSPELYGKNLELLRAILPQISRVALLWNPNFPGTAPYLKATDEAARQLNIKLQYFKIREASEYDAAFVSLVSGRAEAVVVFAEPLSFQHRRHIVDLAAKHRLPVTSLYSEFVNSGGLLSYGPNLTDYWRRAARYVDEILKGAKPADLPVEQPTKFELVINLKTAKALGLTIPPSLLARADEVVE